MYLPGQLTSSSVLNHSAGFEEHVGFLSESHLSLSACVQGKPVHAANHNLGCVMGNVSRVWFPYVDGSRVGPIPLWRCHRNIGIPSLLVVWSAIFGHFWSHC
ncbi:MAG: hypothetical protein [Circular genetic element sp.]|nr:MAG: hypothetical protein [Circular genetic element sp.]